MAHVESDFGAAAMREPAQACNRALTQCEPGLSSILVAVRNLVTTRTNATIINDAETR